MGKPPPDRSGQLELIDVSLDEQRDDYVFAGIVSHEPLIALSLMRGAMFNVLLPNPFEGVATSPHAYLATFTFKVSSDAAGTFVVDLDDWAKRSDNLEQTFFNANFYDLIEIESTRPAVIVVSPERAGSVR